MLGFMTRSAAALTIALATLTACDSAPSAPVAGSPARTATLAASASSSASVTPIRQSATVPYVFGFYVPCANGAEGDIFTANGQLTFRGQYILTVDERLHHQVIETFVGTATAWGTGETYDIRTRALDQGTQVYGDDGILDSGELLQLMRFRLTSQTTGAVIDVELDAHFVQIPSGEFVLSGWDGTSRCR